MNNFSLKKFIPFFIGLAIQVIFLLASGVFDITEERVLYRTLSDSCFVPGIFLTMFYILFKVSGAGGLWGVSYLFHGLRQRFIPFGSKGQKTYADFIEHKKKKNEKLSLETLLFAGLIFLAFAVVFLMLYIRAKM